MSNLIKIGKNVMTNYKQLHILILFFVMTGCSQNILAACTRADLTGTWKIYSHLENYSTTWEYGVIGCNLIMPVSGQATSANLVCSHYIAWDRGTVTKLLLSGNLTIDAACHIVGVVTVGDQKRNVDGWISKGKDSISGMMWNPTVNGHDLSEIFSGVKQ